MWTEIGSFVTGIGIHADDLGIVEKHRDEIKFQLPHIVDALYEHLFALGYGGYFVGVDVDDLKRRQIDHWNRLFEGIFDEIFENYARIIGHIHRDRNVGQSLYMQTYAYFTDELICRLYDSSSVDDCDRMRLCRAVTKFIFFDMTVAVSTYHVVYID